MCAWLQGKERNSTEGDGVVHQAMDELFKVLNEKAVVVGECGVVCRSMCVEIPHQGVPHDPCSMALCAATMHRDALEARCHLGQKTDWQPALYSTKGTPIA